MLRLAAVATIACLAGINTSFNTSPTLGTAIQIWFTTCYSMAVPPYAIAYRPTNTGLPMSLLPGTWGKVQYCVVLSSLRL